jgi:hypothetical protein
MFPRLWLLFRRALLALALPRLLLSHLAGIPFVMVEVAGLVGVKSVERFFRTSLEFEEVNEFPFDYVIVRIFVDVAEIPLVCIVRAGDAPEGQEREENQNRYSFHINSYENSSIIRNYSSSVNMAGQAMAEIA